MSQSLQTSHVVFALDCPDAHALADFYVNLLGWQKQAYSDEWVEVLPPDDSAGFHLACQRIADYREPTWPTGNTPQQAHLDLYVDSVEASTQIALDNGATKHEVQPSEDGNFVVFTDPVGHPFCLCQN